MPRKSITERFWAKVDKSGECWIWTGATAGPGYGRMYCGQGGRRNEYAHRLVLEFAGIVISDGLTVDHLCRNTLCVNPDHLDVVTHRENVLRSQNPASMNAKKTHCLRGHAFNEENTYRAPGNHGRTRKCKACALDRRAVSRAERARAATPTRSP